MVTTAELRHNERTASFTDYDRWRRCCFHPRWTSRGLADRSTTMVTTIAADAARNETTKLVVDRMRSVRRWWLYQWTTALADWSKITLAMIATTGNFVYDRVWSRVTIVLADCWPRRRLRREDDNTATVANGQLFAAGAILGLGWSFPIHVVLRLASPNSATTVPGFGTNVSGGKKSDESRGTGPLGTFAAEIL